jgi:hypothetical protein
MLQEITNQFMSVLDEISSEEYKMLKLFDYHLYQIEEYVSRDVHNWDLKQFRPVMLRPVDAEFTRTGNTFFIDRGEIHLCYLQSQFKSLVLTNHVGQVSFVFVI